MRCFHASRFIYDVGDVIRVPDGQDSRAYQLGMERGFQWREDALEAARPQASPGRRRAVYAANTPGNAACFLVSQQDAQNRPVLVYEVETHSVSASPMVLIGHLDALGPDFPALGACIGEYWAPQMAWKFLEFVCADLTVTTSLGPIVESYLWTAFIEYDEDRELARRTWRK